MNKKIDEGLEKYGAKYVLDMMGLWQWRKGKDVDMNSSKYLVSNKWDGWSTCLRVEKNVGKLYSVGHLVKEIKCSLPDGYYFNEWIENTSWSYTFLKGKYHGWLVVLDYLNDSAAKNYSDRIFFLEEYFKENKEKLKEQKIRLVKSFKGLVVQEVYDRAVDKGFEGIVCTDKFNVKYKLKKVFTRDYVVLGFEESESTSYKGNAVKGLIYGLPDGTKVGRVGSFKLSLRCDMHKFPEKYLGRVCEVSGKGVFPGGALRHPSFLRFRDDKNAKDIRNLD